jgi:hypothetical protein
MPLFRAAPARFWRAFFVSACCASAIAGAASPKGPAAPPLTQMGAADPTEARLALEQVRKLGIQGNYFFEFQLRVMPRRGEERLFSGQLWGSRNNLGAISRVAIRLPAEAGTPSERRLLIQNGRSSSVWRWDTGGAVEMLGAASPFDPVVPGTDLTAFDLQMPFIYWDEFKYDGLTRFRGRPAHIFVMTPPTSFAAKFPAVSGVKVYLDTQFNALVQTQILGPNRAVLKTLSLVDLKKVGEQWIPKTLDVRDEATRNKTRFEVVSAGLDLDFSGILFEPARLDESISPPPAARLTKLNP